jgi:hypothetical protein
MTTVAANHPKKALQQRRRNDLLRAAFDLD